MNYFFSWCLWTCDLKLAPPSQPNIYTALYCYYRHDICASTYLSRRKQANPTLIFINILSFSACQLTLDSLLLLNSFCLLSILFHYLGLFTDLSGHILASDSCLVATYFWCLDPTPCTLFAYCRCMRHMQPQEISRAIYCSWQMVA